MLFTIANRITNLEPGLGTQSCSSGTQVAEVGGVLECRSLEQPGKPNKSLDCWLLKEEREGGGEKERGREGKIKYARI